MVLYKQYFAYFYVRTKINSRKLSPLVIGSFLTDVTFLNQMSIFFPEIWISIGSDCMLLSCHVRGSESIYTLRICLNVKELFAWKRRHIWNLSDCTGIRIHNHFVRKQILSHFAKLAMFVCELSGCVFESLCSHLNFRYDMISLTFRKNYRV